MRSVFTIEDIRGIAAAIDFRHAVKLPDCITRSLDVLSRIPPDAPANINYPDGTVRELSSSELRGAIRLFASGGHIDGTVKVSLGTGSDLGVDSWRAVFRGAQVQVNLFLSTKSSTGVKAHFDDHHVFAVQIEGEKNWSLGGVVTVASRERVSRYPMQDPPIKRELTTYPGDILYMPPGEWHGTATPERSVHLTVGVYPPTYADVMRAAIRERAQFDPLIRTYLPLALSDNGSVQPRGFSQEDLALIAARIPRLSVSSRQHIHEDMQLAQTARLSEHEARLAEVLEAIGSSPAISVYGRGSAARGEREPWDIDFVVVTGDDQSANELAAHVGSRPVGEVPVDIKVISTTHLASTPDGRAKRIQYATEAVLLWGEDVLSSMSSGALDSAVLADMRARVSKVARANIDALRKRGDVDRRRVAKSIIRIGSPIASESMNLVTRVPMVCAAFLVFEYPHLSTTVRRLVAALDGSVGSQDIIEAGETILRTTNDVV